jgi:hypothetical protein
MVSIYAASVDGTLYGFRYSPLGVLSDNAHCLPDPAPSPHGVRLYQQREGEWGAVCWPSHMWWVRFLLTAHTTLLGTQPVRASRRAPRTDPWYESLAHLRVTSRFLRWWLRVTPLPQRVAFFQNPDVRGLCRTLRRESWAQGHHGDAHLLLRLARGFLPEGPPQAIARSGSRTPTSSTPAPTRRGS